MFPDFYHDQGPDFVAFIKAYYEWLEQNHQLLTLDTIANFAVGDSVVQGSTTGKVIAVTGNDLLVYVNGLDTFKCFTICASLELITSSSGGQSHILKGGTSRRLGTLFLARNLLDIKDIDLTIDLFITHFKEKYLKNIEFDTQTNKRLLVKHSLDLYRSKGTQRSVDLFFRLVYGVQAEVYYPGDDLFKLSAGDWTKPVYLEITSNSELRAVSLVGRQVTGVTSKASAFVEKYVKRTVKNGTIHVLYLSNVRGKFVNNELIVNKTIYQDSPVVQGSLSDTLIVTGGKLFSVGDLVSFSSVHGDKGQARVSSIKNKTGVVDFALTTGGYGYSDNMNPSYTDLLNRTQDIVSTYVVSVTNVVTSNSVASITVGNGGTGYNNTDTIVATSNLVNAIAKVYTNTTGGIVSTSITTPGCGFYTNTTPYAIANSTGGVSTGTGAVLTVATGATPRYYTNFESFIMPIFAVNYTSNGYSNNFTVGANVYVSNSTTNCYATVISNAPTNANTGLIQVWTNNLRPLPTGTIKLTSANTIVANIANVTNLSAISSVMYSPNVVTLDVGSVVGAYTVPLEVYQVINGVEAANGIVSNVITTSPTSATITVANLNGIMLKGNPILCRTTSTTAQVLNVRIDVGIYNLTAGQYSTILNLQAFSNITGTSANLSSISIGSYAAYGVSSITDTEVVQINTNYIGANNSSNIPFLQVLLSANSYGFPSNPSANANTIMLSALTYANLTIGTIDGIITTNPGTNYNIVPDTLTYQPYIAGYRKRDYVITTANNSGSFVAGEKVLQGSIPITSTQLAVTNASGYIVGEKVYQGTIGSETAVGQTYYIDNIGKILRVHNNSGTFTSPTPLKSYISPGISANTTAVTPIVDNLIGKAIVKSANGNTITLKRTQFTNNFVVGGRLTGQQSLATAYISTIAPDVNSTPIGMNAIVSANVVTANGTVTGLEIIDSGVGYSNGDYVSFTSADGSRNGSAQVILDGIGHGAGYYKNQKGSLSSTSFIHDGDYYQEYSYDIMSKIPLEKYSAMFKKVIHTAGTRFFGSILLEEELDVLTDVGTTERSQAYYIDVEFDSASNNTIMFNNLLDRFPVNHEVLYYTNDNAVSLPYLANNLIYYVSSANSTGIQLKTSPNDITYTFDSNSISNNVILLTRNNYKKGDVVTYTSNGSAISGISNGTYMVFSSNATGITLSNGYAGPTINIASTYDGSNGYQFHIGTVPIVVTDPSSVYNIHIDVVINTLYNGVNGLDFSQSNNSFYVPIIS